MPGMHLFFVLVYLFEKQSLSMLLPLSFFSQLHTLMLCGNRLIKKQECVCVLFMTLYVFPFCTEATTISFSECMPPGTVIVPIIFNICFNRLAILFSYTTTESFPKILERKLKTCLLDSFFLISFIFFFRAIIILRGGRLVYQPLKSSNWKSISNVQTTIDLV